MWHFVRGLVLCYGVVSSLLATPVTPESYEKEKKYPVADIPKELLLDALAVVRLDEQLFEVYDINSGIHNRKLVITILNEQAQEYGYFVNSYFGKSGLVQFSGTVYDAFGNEVDKIRKSDLEDRSSFDGFSIYSDSRYESITYSRQQYPYTVEYEFSEKYDGMMFYPGWNVQWGTKLSVEKATYKVLVPKSMGLRYKEINIPSSVKIEEMNGQILHSWSIGQLSPIVADASGPNWVDLTPKVIVGPNSFEFEGYSGDMSSWESFGRWQQLVNQDLGGISQEQQVAVQALVDNAKDKRDIVRKVYHYLQQNTRYVSVQLGIGGWQPFAPTYVEANGYGDCKALSYYTKAMLEAVGIESIYTLVHAGRKKKRIYTDFPSDQFNHVFLCVPMEQDTVWLECTSQTNPFGYLGTFTSDRPVLLITDDGGKLVRTPTLSKEQNQKSTTATAVIDLEGNAKVELSTKYRGYFFERINQRVIPLGPEDQKKWLYNNLELPSFKIDRMSFETSGEETPQITQSLEVTVRKKASVSGKRLFLQPNLLNQVSYVPKAMDDRKTNIVIDYNRVWSDTVNYILPELFHPEYLPEGISVESSFGKYQVDIIQEQNTIKYIRRLELTKGDYLPELYDEYREFFERIVKADKAKIVLKNTT